MSYVSIADDIVAMPNVVLNKTLNILFYTSSRPSDAWNLSRSPRFFPKCNAFDLRMFLFTRTFGDVHLTAIRSKLYQDLWKLQFSSCVFLCSSVFIIKVLVINVRFFFKPSRKCFLGVLEFQVRMRLQHTCLLCQFL